MITTIDQISDKQFQAFLPSGQTMSKIGNKKAAIQALRELGYSSLEGFQSMIDNEGHLGMQRIGNTYYWVDQ